MALRGCPGMRGGWRFGRRGSGKRCDGVFGVVVDVEEREQAAHGQGLKNDLGRAGQPDRASGLFGGLQRFDEEADAAGVEAIDAGDFEHDAVLAMSDEVVDGLAKAVGGRAEDEGTAQSHRGDVAVPEERNVE